MGDVKEAVKGSSKVAPKLTEKNLVERFTSLSDELSELTTKKDEDVLSEGDAAKAENLRKAGILRACSSLTRTIKQLLESY